MRLPLNRRDDDPAPAGADAVESARTRARRRLIGAVVLLAIGVVGFPLLFETEPRPVALDVPIVTASREAPSPRASAPSRQPPPAVDAPVEEARPATGVPGATLSSRARPEAPAMAASAAEPAATPPAAPVAAATTALPGVKAATSATAPARAASAVAEAAAAAPSAPARGRFVVQVGAYTDPATLREARARVERLGLKTYTQVIENDAGRRTRVRVGPFATRDDANAAIARLKAAGLPAHLLAL